MIQTYEENCIAWAVRLLEPHAICQHLGPEHFQDPLHKQVMEVLCGMIADDAPLNIVELGRRGRLTGDQWHRVLSYSAAGTLGPIHAVKLLLQEIFRGRLNRALVEAEARAVGAADAATATIWREWQEALRSSNQPLVLANALATYVKTQPVDELDAEIVLEAIEAFRPQAERLRNLRYLESMPQYIDLAGPYADDLSRTLHRRQHLTRHLARMLRTVVTSAHVPAEYDRVFDLQVS